MSRYPEYVQVLADKILSGEIFKVGEIIQKDRRRFLRLIISS